MSNSHIEDFRGKIEASNSHIGDVRGKMKVSNSHIGDFKGKLKVSNSHIGYFQGRTREFYQMRNLSRPLRTGSKKGIPFELPDLIKK